VGRIESLGEGPTAVGNVDKGKEGNSHGTKLDVEGVVNVPNRDVS